MRYIRGLSADMEDLLNEQGRLDAENFFTRFLWSINEGVFNEAKSSQSKFTPSTVSIPEQSNNKKISRDVVIITDLTDSESNLAQMIERFRVVFGYTTRIVNISEYPFSGGCLG